MRNSWRVEGENPSNNPHNYFVPQTNHNPTIKRCKTLQPKWTIIKLFTQREGEFSGKKSKSENKCNEKTGFN